MITIIHDLESLTLNGNNYILDSNNINHCIGCGEIIGLTKERKILKIFCCDFFKKIKIFKNNIDKNNKIYLKTNIKLLNKKLFCLICNHYFKKRIK